MQAIESIPRPKKEKLAELLREKARRNYLPFATGIKSGYDNARHIEFVAGKLEAVERGDINKLMISLPPRHSKTETSVVRFIPWYLGRNPDNRVMYVTYGALLARNKSRLARTIMKMPRYHNIFPGITLRQDSHAVQFWNIEGYDGGVQACGIDGAITGEGANLLLLDDLIKNRKEAESEAVRESAWVSLRSDIESRLEPNAPIIFITTRWHKDDPAGRYLEEEAEEWEVIKLPAIAEEKDPIGRAQDEALWPERWPLEKLMERKAKVGSYAWASIYQQSPVPAEGGAVKRAWIQWYSHPLVPESAFYGGIDTATSQKTAGHDSAIAELAVDLSGNIYMHSGISGQYSVKGFSELVCSHHTTRKFTNITIELNNAGEAIKQRIEEIGRDRRIYPPITGEHAKADKMARLLPWTPLIESGIIKFNARDPWVVKLVDHLCNFGPGDDYDDVDAFVWALEAVKHGGTTNWDYFMVE